MTSAMLLIAPVVLPFLAAALALVLRKHVALTRAVGLAAYSALAILSVLLFVRTGGGQTVPMTVFGDWPRGISVSFSATMPSAALLVVTALITLAAGIYAINDIGWRRRRNGFDALMLAMVGAVNGAFLTDDLFYL